MRNRKGITLVELIVAIAILGIIAVSLITGFASQLMNINRGTDITVQAMDAQATFEELIYDVKTEIQEPEGVSIPEWSSESVEVLGASIEMQKIMKNYSNDAKDNTIFLSKRLAEIEEKSRIPVEGVMIEVSNDDTNLVADLSLSPLPTLKAIHDDNTGEPGFYVNLYRWWKSVPGKDISSLKFPEDFSVVNVSLTTDVLTNLLDNVGAGRFVALTVTPVDIHGFRGNTVVSSNYVFVKGAEWRIGMFPWADTNNDYNLDSDDVRIKNDRIKEVLNAKTHTIPNFYDENEMLSIRDSSLFVPMNIEPGGGQIPGEIPVDISGSEIVDWSFENNINLAKDIMVSNGSDVTLTAGTGASSGSIYLYPYIELDSSGNPVTINGAPKIIEHGASIITTGDLTLKSLSRGDIELIRHNELKGDTITLEARGSILIEDSSLDANDDIIFNTMKNPEISGERSIQLKSTLLSSTNPDKKVRFDTRADVLFKGGGWSSNQTLYIADDKNILFTKDDTKIDNKGSINVGNTGRMFFEHSMAEDLARPLRIRLERSSNDTFLLTTINYNRNVSYANSSNQQQIILSGLWTKLGSGNHNYEFSARVLNGPGAVNDLAYSYDDNGKIKIEVLTSQQRLTTRVKFDVRDRFNNDIVGSGYFKYSVNSSGQPTIDIEEPPPLDYFTITFNTNGGSEIAPIGGYVGESVGTVPDPTRTGYDFIGWDIPVPIVIPAQDLELTAIWQSIYYTITLDSNGGPPISNMTYIYGQQISIPNPSRTGYTFAGWDSTPPATMPAEDLQFVAQWTQNELTITFDSNGGSAPNPSAKNVFFDSEYGGLPSPTRAGYILDGWYSQLVGGTKITESSIVNNANNHILYAQWLGSHQQLALLSINPTNQRNTFTLTFNNNIQSVVSTNLGNISNFIVDNETVRYDGNNTSEGNYQLRVKDIYGQELTVNLRLRKSTILWWTWWTWSIV